MSRNGCKILNIMDAKQSDTLSPFDAAAISNTLIAEAAWSFNVRRLLLLRMGVFIGCCINFILDQEIWTKVECRRWKWSCVIMNWGAESTGHLRKCWNSRHCGNLGAISGTKPDMHFHKDHQLCWAFPNGWRPLTWMALTPVRTL